MQTNSRRSFFPDPPPPPPLAVEACAFGAYLGNRSVFILDPRLLSQE